MVGSTAVKFAGRSSTPLRIVRFFCLDTDATDSSNGEEMDASSRRQRRRVKRHVQEIAFEAAVTVRGKPLPQPKQPPHMPSPPTPPPPTLPLPAAAHGKRKKFRGVRQRRWGRFAAEIRNPILRKRLWLGTFDTAVEAAIVYDAAAVQLKGDKAITNFPNPMTEHEAPEAVALKATGYCGREPPLPLSSPTSVLQYSGEEESFDVDCLGYVDAFGLSVAEPALCLAESFCFSPAIWGENFEFEDIENFDEF